MRFKWTKWGTFSGKGVKTDQALLSKTFLKPPKKAKQKLCEVMNVLIVSSLSQ